MSRVSLYVQRIEQTFADRFLSTMKTQWFHQCPIRRVNRGAFIWQQPRADLNLRIEHSESDLWNCWIRIAEKPIVTDCSFYDHVAMPVIHILRSSSYVCKLHFPSPLFDLLDLSSKTSDCLEQTERSLGHCFVPFSRQFPYFLETFLETLCLWNLI